MSLSMTWSQICATLLDLYTSYLVLGVIIFSAKLGEDAEQIGFGSISRWLPGGFPAKRFRVLGFGVKGVGFRVSL